MDKNTLPTTQHIRRATPADIAFLTWCNLAATSPEPDFSYWDPLLAGTNSSAQDFVAALLAVDGLAWGKISDYLILEENGKPIAGASGFVMNPADYRPLDTTKLPVVATNLGWSEAQLLEFCRGYESVWADPQDVVLSPQAPWIIECVAVKPAHRGRGVAQTLLSALLEEGKRRGFSHAGISVTIGNVPAEQAYTALGFKLYIAYGEEYFRGAYPGTIKYRMRLQ
jgi:ribosomal protein S18 acetylase RimI-like enzyme